MDHSFLLAFERTDCTPSRFSFPSSRKPCCALLWTNNLTVLRRVSRQSISGVDIGFGFPTVLLEGSATTTAVATRKTWYGNQPDNNDNQPDNNDNQSDNNDNQPDDNDNQSNHFFSRLMDKTFPVSARIATGFDLLSSHCDTVCVSLVHCCTLSLCYLGAETDDHQRNPNIKNKDHIVGDYFSVSRTQVQTKLFRPLELPLHFCIFPPLLQVGLSCQQARGCASTKFLH